MQKVSARARSHAGSSEYHDQSFTCGGRITKQMRQQDSCREDRSLYTTQKHYPTKLRKSYCMGPQRILVRHGVSRMPRNVGRRAVHTHRYAKEVPGRHVQVDVKIVSFRDADKHPVRRFQYTAINDAARVRALKIYNRHNQANAIKFIDCVVDKFPFRIRTIRTDRGHELQALFHWHVEDKGMRHVYIKPRSPELNGKS